MKYLGILCIFILTATSSKSQYREDLKWLICMHTGKITNAEILKNHGFTSDSLGADWKNSITEETITFYNDATVYTSKNNLDYPTESELMGCPVHKKTTDVFEMTDQKTGAAIVESISYFTCKSQCGKVKVQIKSEPGYMEISIR